MRWAWILMLASLAAAIPNAQACTSGPPPPVADFDRLAWDGQTVTTTWGGREVTWDVDSSEWQMGGPAHERGGCDPGPKRAGIADPDGHWMLEYADQVPCCMGTWTYGPLRLHEGDATLHEWGKQARWIGFDSGVVVHNGSLDWISYGPPDVVPGPAVQAIVGRFAQDTAFVLDHEFTLMRLPNGQTEAHPYPDAMGTVYQWWPVSDGIVVGDGAYIAWFNGSFGPAVSVQGAVHVLDDVVLYQQGATLIAAARDGGLTEWGKTRVHAAVTGPASSAVAVWSQGIAYVWILQDDHVVGQQAMPQEMPGSTGTAIQTMYHAAPDSGTGHESVTTTPGPDASGTENADPDVPAPWGALAIVAAVFLVRRW